MMTDFNQELVAKIFETIKNKTSTADTKFDMAKTGTIKENFKNVLTAITDQGLVVRRNVFSGVVEIANADGFFTLAKDQEGPLSDTTLAYLRKHIQDRLNFDPKAELLASAIMSLAEEERYNPVVEWLGSIYWDGTLRLARWLPEVTGCEDDHLNCAIGELLIMGMVARARYPGTKFDYCVVFEGRQGCGKSTLVRILASGPGDSYFVDAPGLIGMDNKQRAELTGGKWVVELAELSGLARSESEGVKAFITQTTDRFRPPYGRVTIERPRSCVFIGTTNAQTYLSDNSGNRRFLPVECDQVDLILLQEDYTQIVAEADHQLAELVRRARSAGIQIEQNKSLPFEFVNRYLTLPTALREAASERTEMRRHTDTMEEAVRSVMERDLVTRQQLPDGRQFMPSADLLSALRLHLNSNVNSSGLAGWMARLGWEHTTIGPKNARIRGYASREMST